MEATRIFKILALIITVPVLFSSATHQNATAKIFDSEVDVSMALARYTARLSQKYIQQKGSFTLVLSGGTLISTLRQLVSPPYNTSVDWSKWMVFWVDERVVPLDDPLSNYKLALEGFLSKVAIPESNIYPITYKSSAEEVASDYESRLKSLVDRNVIPSSADGSFPRFDLILLGIGPDGHVASLFPDRPQRYEDKRWVTSITDSPKPPPSRITFTFPVINSASDIAMVVTGSDLAHAVALTLKCAVFPEVPPPPSGQVKAQEELIWFLDRGAASELHQ